MKLRDTSITQFLKNSPFKNMSPINIRDCFYGARTNGTRLYAKANADDDGSSIYYMDIKSLYPTVNKVSF
jgi:hypothetical protein